MAWQRIPPATWAKERTEPLFAHGDPLPRIQCLDGYTATIYAEGLASPDGLAFSPTGILYVAEETAGRVSRIEADGSSTPVLTNLNSPEGIAFDQTGHLYVVEDVENGRLLQMAPNGTTSPLATNLAAPEGVVWANNALYLTESNVQFTAGPADYLTKVTTVSPPNSAVNIRSDPFFWSYAAITSGPENKLYISNEAAGTGTTDAIFVVDPVNSGRTTFVNAGLTTPEGLRFTSSGDFPLYVAEENTGSGAGRLSRVDKHGRVTAFCTGFGSIEDVITGADGRIYLSEDSTGLIIVLTPPTPHGIILFIGDGMGAEHRQAAQWLKVGQSGLLTMDDMPVSGWSQTAAANVAVTDSAAAATALATGVKTNKDIVGQTPEGYNLRTILERAQGEGWAVGLITTTPIAHATPAGFAAHVDHRSQTNDIAAQMLSIQVDVLLAGGENDFLPVGTPGCYAGDGDRQDGRHLINEALAAGYTYVCTEAGFNSVNPATTARLLGLFADGGMNRPYQPSLAAMTQKAIDILAQNPAGFFLMVEGGQIDWASHDNDAANTLNDIIGLDEAVAVAQTYAATISNTLVIVTADHETGGMSADLTSSGASNEDGPFQMPGTTPFYINWQTVGHTSADVPTTAQGPWSDLLAGTYPNTHIHQVMCQALNPGKDQVVGHLFKDENGDGSQNTGEPDLVGVSILITDTLGFTHTATTNSDGHYTAIVPVGPAILDVDNTTLPFTYTFATANDPQTVDVAGCQTTLSPKVGYKTWVMNHRSFLPIILNDH